MPNGPTHTAIGAGLSAIVATANCGDLPDSGQVIDSLAATIGGGIGGRLPDILEPAVHSHHRGVCHSVAIGTAVVALAGYVCRTAGAQLRATAAEHRANRMPVAPNDPRHMSLWLQEHAIYALLGFGLGLPVGYASHIAADMTTPRGVPFVSRGVG